MAIRHNLAVGYLKSRLRFDKLVIDWNSAGRAEGGARVSSSPLRPRLPARYGAQIPLHLIDLVWGAPPRASALRKRAA